MVKADTRALNLLLPKDLSEWFTDYAKSLGKTKTEIICSLLQGIKNGDAYSDVDNPVDGIESIVKAYLDKHLQSHIDNYLHGAKQADVDNPVDADVDTDVDNPVDADVDDSDALPIIEAISTIEAPMIENSLDSNALNEALTKEKAYNLACSRGFVGTVKSFSESFSKNEKTFGDKYGLRRWKKAKGKTAPYFYSDIR